jgi:hypothetical protein
MPEIVSDNDPFQLPQAAADQYYARTDPGLPAFVAATLGDGPTAYLLRGAQRGTVEGASFFDRFLANTGNRDPESEMFGGQPSEPIQSPDMAPADYNEKYAPRDTTGAIQPIGDQPMPEALAAIIGQEKSDAMQREGVLRRYVTATEKVWYKKSGTWYQREEPAHGWAGTFLVGTAAPMLDPLDAAGMFLPGVGEG